LGYTLSNKNDIASTAEISNSEIIAPCYIGENVKIVNSKIGPHVSLGKGVQISSGTIRDSILMDSTSVESSDIEHSMIGKSVNISGFKGELNLGDFSAVKQN
jgi:glucose-1-phosphate thymidylyltransferase